jgi:hypothetical protein
LIAPTVGAEDGHVPNRIRPTAEWRPVLLVAVCVVLVYGWWFTDLQPFSTGATRALLIAVGVVIILATVRRLRAAPSASDRPTREASHFTLAVVVWSAIGVAIITWELLALRSLPRSAHPTISSFVESIEQYHVARLGLYALWIALGWMLAS